MSPESPKDALRQLIQQRRSRLTPEQWRDLGARTATLAVDALPADVRVVALYAARDDEPPTRALIDALTSRGCRALLPRLGASPDWAWFTGWDSMRTGWGAIPEPTGPALGAEALSQAEFVVVPCLAVSRDGTRLGTGGGWYDRALLHRSLTAPVWALARTSEVMASLPREPHDVPVTRILTETGWVDCVG